MFDANSALSCVKIRIISKLTELSLEPRHLRVPLGTPYRFLSRRYVWCKPCTDLAPTITLSLKRKNWDSTWPMSLRVPSGASKMIFEPMVHSMQTVHLSCIKISTVFEKDQNEIALEARHLVVPSCASKMISEPTVRLGQTMHLSCTNTNIVSKRKKRDYTWSTSPRSFIRWVQNDF
jgi:hypothetical protein